MKGGRFDKHFLLVLILAGLSIFLLIESISVHYWQKGLISLLGLIAAGLYHVRNKLSVTLIRIWLVLLIPVVIWTKTIEGQDGIYYLSSNAIWNVSPFSFFTFTFKLAGNEGTLQLGINVITFLLIYLFSKLSSD